MFLFLSNLFSTTAECPDCNYNDFILSIGKENERYLVYAGYFNFFDTCDISCSIGEFRWVDSNGVVNRIYLNLNPEICNRNKPWVVKLFGNEYVLGSSEPGEDSLLTNAVRSEVFRYKPNSKIYFFRELRAARSCEGISPEDTTVFSCPDIPLFFHIDFLNCILDTSEWVIQLVRAEDHQILTTIDSVGFLPNGNCPYAIAYGNEPYRMNHIRDLPDEFANLDVYIRISARRWGPTPFGLLFGIIISRANFSAFEEYMECEGTNGILGRKCNFEWSRFNRFYYEKVIEYLDSIVAVNNRPPYYSELPRNRYFLFSDTDYNALILNRYYSYDSANKLWIIPPEPNDSNLQRTFVKTELGEFTPQMTKYVIDNLKIQNEGNRAILTIKISQQRYQFPEENDKETEDFIVYLYALDGALIKSQRFDIKHNGRIELTMDVPNRLAVGIYLVTIFYENSTQSLTKYVLLR